MIIWSSVSLARFQFGEDPVTQIVDLLVIKDTPLVCTSKTTQTNSVCIAQPWTPTFCHPHSVVTLYNEELRIPQLPQSTMLSNTPMLLTSPRVLVYMHSTTSYMLGCTFFYLFSRGEDWTFPTLPSDFSWTGSLNIILAWMVYFAVSERTCTVAHPPPPPYTIKKEMFR